MSRREVFGTPDQQELQARALNLWELVRDDPRMSFHGRVVSLVTGGPRDVPLLAALAALQGGANMNFAPREAMSEMQALLEARGLRTDVFETRIGGPGALEAARRVLSTAALPEGLTIEEIGPGTPDACIAALDGLAVACGALLPAGLVLRGQPGPAVSLMVRDPDGAPVAMGLACRFHHPDGPLADHAFWGGLLTREDWRGRRLALILGARAMAKMHARYGFDHFATGVRAGNRASENLCDKLAVLPSRYRTLIAIDPDRFPGAQLTK